MAASAQAAKKHHFPTADRDAANHASGATTTRFQVM
jgi:hypothetical protein